MNMTKNDMSFHLKEALVLLADYLRHHGKPIIVLFDNYDSIINNALFNCKSEDDFKTIISTISCILSSLAKYNSDVDRIVITGTSHITISS